MDNKINLPGRILWINNTLQSDTYCVKPHAHESYCHLIYVESGRCILMLNGEHYELTSGMYSIAFPDDTHCIESVPDGDCARLWEIKYITVSQTVKEALSGADIVLSADAYEKAQLSEIISLSQEKTGNLNAISMAFGSFLYHLSAKFESHRDSDDSVYLLGINTAGFSRATIETVKYAEKNYMHDISLEDIGQAIGYNKNYISTMVKRDLTINVNEVISFIRIREAAEMLYYSDESINNICRQCNFKTLSHFSRIFKKYVGVPPTQYRRSYPDNAFIDAAKDDLSPKAVPLWVRFTLKDYIEARTE